jgi:hypothetical protein
MLNVGKVNVSVANYSTAIELRWEDIRQLILGMKNEVNIRYFIPSGPRLQSIEFPPSYRVPVPADRYRIFPL